MALDSEIDGNGNSNSNSNSTGIGNSKNLIK